MSRVVTDLRPGTGRETVYFVRCRETGDVKVGRSANPLWRLKNIRRDGKPCDLEVLVIYWGGSGDEIKMHAYLEPDHIGSEWFSPTKRVLGTALLIANDLFDWDLLPVEGWEITKPFQTKASLAHWGPLRAEPKDAAV